MSVSSFTLLPLPVLVLFFVLFISPWDSLVTVSSFVISHFHCQGIYLGNFNLRESSSVVAAMNISIFGLEHLET